MEVVKIKKGVYYIGNPPYGFIVRFEGDFVVLVWEHNGAIIKLKRGELKEILFYVETLEKYERKGSNSKESQQNQKG